MDVASVEYVSRMCRVYIYIFRAYFCDLVGVGETGVQPMQSALISYLFEPICKYYNDSGGFIHCLNRLS